MQNNSTKAKIIFDAENHRFHCEGHWSTLKLGDLPRQFARTTLPRNQSLSISGKSIKRFDSAGAMALFQCIQELKKHHNQVELIDFCDKQQNLLSLVEKKSPEFEQIPSPRPAADLLTHIGKEAVIKVRQTDGFVMLVGDFTEKIYAALLQWKRFQFSSIVSNIHSTGITALPILALLSFLIGVVLAYQMGIQLETYGANIFIAYLSGMALFREFAPLITAIIVAGRTSSAFTAQIGSMKINEEIDALYTMGLSPTELLVVPKVLGLFIIFPLLIFWSDFFSVLGAMLMSKSMLHVGYIDFLTRLRESVGFKQMMLGIYKSPSFSILIALVGCFQGFQVEMNADSVGKQTTRSVVQALFLIIVTDAIYSVIYSWLDL